MSSNSSGPKQCRVQIINFIFDGLNGVIISILQPSRLGESQRNLTDFMFCGVLQVPSSFFDANRQKVQIVKHINHTHYYSFANAAFLIIKFRFYWFN